MLALLSALSLGAEYREADARAFSRLTSAAYCQDDILLGWECVPCAQSGLNVTSIKVFADKSTDARAFVAHTTTDLVVLAIRGSETIENFIKDLEFLKADKPFGCKACYVHSGFYETWNSIRADSIAEVKRLLAAAPKAPVVVTGHSLGAAVALLATYELTQAGVAVNSLYTYGSPRVGNQAFASHMNQSVLRLLPRGTWRHTHWRDPVPHLPLHSMDFQHVPREVWSDEKCLKETVCDGSGEDPTCANSLSLFYGVSDHLFYLGYPIGADTCVAAPGSDHLKVDDQAV